MRTAGVAERRAAGIVIRSLLRAALGLAGACTGCAIGAADLAANGAAVADDTAAGRATGAAALAANGAAVAGDTALFAYDAAAPLDVEIGRRSRNRGFTLVQLDYASPDGGRVPALLYEPALVSASPAPAVLLMHGLPGSRGSLSSLAAAYARAGVYVLAISAPWARRPAYRPFSLLPTPLFDDHDRAELVQLIRDLRRAVDYLESDPRIAADRIAFVGHSAGGMAGALLAGVEQRVAAWVLMAATPGWISTIRHYEATRPDEFWLEPLDALTAEQRAAWTRGLEPLEATHWIGNARAPMLLQAGTLDRSVPAADVQRLFDAASEPKSIEWYALPHALGPTAFADQARFLARHLGFPADRFVAPDRM